MKRALWFAGAVAGILWLELRRPLRKQRESKLVRDTRNLAIAGLAGLVTGMMEAPAARWATRMAVAHRLGLQRLPAPDWVRDALAVAALDYTLYLWHVTTHRVPFLWRMHAVHHADRDLDASTAVRFHFAEMTMSVPYRAAQVLVIGASPRAFQWWQQFLFLSIFFHHSNARLPWELERRLAWLVMTPRLHGIHHSRVKEEVDSNWSSGLTIWDRLHGTYREDVPQSDIVIGVPGYDSEEAVRLRPMLAAPFVHS